MQRDPLFLTKILDLLVDAVCVVDPQGRFVFVSSACERIFGYTPEELIGRNMIELVYVADRDRTLEAAQRVMSGHLQVHFENRYVRKDGRVVDIMWSARWSEDDQLRLAVARDITEIKRAERQQRAMYRISEATHAAVDLPELYLQIHQIISELLPGNHFRVALYDETSDTVHFPSLEDGGTEKSTQQELSDDPGLAQVIRSGKPLLTTAGRPADQEHIAGSAGPNWLGVPLTFQGGIMGALVIRSAVSDVRLSAEDQALLQFVSDQVASAIMRKRTEGQLRHMAGHDALTDLPNRVLFQDRFDRALSAALREGTYLALLYLDLNGFKQVNDRFGHDVGDQLLQSVATRLTQALRESDTIARMGGDEFTVLLTRVHSTTAVAAIVEKIRSVIDEPYEIGGEIGGHALKVSASIGSALYPEHGQTRTQLIQHADAEMYAEKSRWRA
ncbi:hypothetical protein A9404_12250 [Halothiobacillus diazotrophicus]|uniref:Diguanylate cyclase n=1 Tax=Halothiobacillus diazotrophicus TaxID=1860122 RepID=A0A191ZJL8_9GAMM|nr:sensor domain-containing diguanylate cyclase [Halothiobacillus diazotrophicus]ANJ68042.1 hypothetical protein A9404_12250 [Halothiobacillus diazotrophicus]